MTVTVTETLDLPSGATPSGITVRITLYGARPVGYAPSGAVVDELVVTPDASTGVWTTPLVPNADITPAGTVYRVRLEGSNVSSRPRYISVPDTGGPYSVEDLLVDAPDAPASAPLAVHAALRGPGGHLPDGTPADGDTIVWDDAEEEFVYDAAAGGSVESIVPGTNIDVDATDPANPIVSVEALTSSDVGLGNVDNTSDANKPVSTLQAAADAAAQAAAEATAAADATTKANAAQAAAVQRANHTGTQLAATISDFSTAVTTVGNGTYAHVVRLSATGDDTDRLADWDAAVAEIDAAGGGVVELGEGTFRTSGWWDIDTSNITVRGLGKGSLIKPLAAANCGGIRVGNGGAEVADITIDAIGFDGNDAEQTAGNFHHGIKVTNARRVTIRGCYITRTHPYHAHNTGGSGISVENTVHDVVIDGNRIYDIGDRGIQCAARGGVIRGNICRDGYDRGISINVLPDSEPDPLAAESRHLGRDLTVTGNVCTGNSDGAGIGIGQGSSATFAMPGEVAANLTIIGNVCADNAHDGIGLRGLRPEDRNVLVVGNSLENNGLGGISVNDSTAPLSLTIANNKITNDDAAGPDYGITLDEDAADVIVQGNTIRGNITVGIDLFDGADRAHLLDNVIEHTGAYASAVGIDVQANVDGTLARGNRVIGSLYGIRTAGLQTKIEGNEIADTTGGAVRVESTARSTVVTGNRVRNPGGHGIHFIGSAGNVDSDGLIMGNDLDDTASPVAGQHGVACYCGPVVIADNWVRGFYNRAVELGGLVVDSKISGNRCEGNTSGTLILVAAARSLIVDNVTLSPESGVGVTLQATAVDSTVRHDQANHGTVSDGAGDANINGSADVDSDLAEIAALADPSTFRFLANSGGVWAFHRPAAVVAEIHADASHVNSTAESADLLGLVLPGGVIAEGDKVVLTVFGDLLQNTGGASTYQLRFKIGAVTVIDTGTVSFNASPSRRSHFHELVVIFGSTSAQRCILNGEMGTVGNSYGSGGFTIAAYGSAAQDTTSAKTFGLTVQMGTASPTGDFVVKAASLEVVKKRNLT